MQQRRQMVEIDNNNLSINKQCEVLQIHRSGLYYQPNGESQHNLDLMLEIDKIHLKWPYYGTRRMTAELQNMGYVVGRKLIRRLMRLMGIEVIYPRQNTSQPNKDHKIYPYLLRGLKIDHINQVWQTDITYIPMKRGFMYLMAVIDVHSRYVLNWSISNSMEATWCTQVVQQAIKKHGTPEIFNTDQGSQFTSELFTEMLLCNNIKISMDGKGRATDNIYIERLWRNVKQENIYLNAYETGLELYKGLEKYFYQYNNHRVHQALNYLKPIDIYKNVA